MALPNVINSPGPEAPRKMSYSCGFTMNKQQARKLRRLFFPPTRPAWVSPRKKVAWRLVRKWFNRYEKPEWLKRTVMVVSKDGKTQMQARITDVRITKAGGQKRDYTFTCNPVTNV